MMYATAGPQAPPNLQVVGPAEQLNVESEGWNKSQPLWDLLGEFKRISQDPP